jgi:hypothetical protein
MVIALSAVFKFAGNPEMIEFTPPVDAQARYALLCLCAAIGATCPKAFSASLADYLKTIFNKTDLDEGTEQLLMQMIQVIAPDSAIVEKI